MKYSEEMRLIFKGYSKDEIAALKAAEEEELKETPPEPKPEGESKPEGDNQDEETIKKFEDYEKTIEDQNAKIKELESEIVKLNNHQSLGEPEKRKDAADVMAELFKKTKKGGKLNGY